MTIDESISILSNAAWLGTDEDRERTEEAVKTAMTALQKDGDNISRKMVIDVLERLIDTGGVFTKDPIVLGALIAVKVAISQLPSVQPEIIRCKDCKYASPNGLYGCRLERFSKNDESVRLFSNDYCSIAERRKDG